MVSAFTPNKRIEQPAHNDYIDSWDVPVNADWAIIDLALGSGVNLNLTGLSGNQVLTAPQYQPLKLIAGGAPTAATNLVVPSGVGGLWVVRNNTTGGFAITIASAAGGSTVTIPVGTNTLVNCDGSATGMFLAINTPPPAAGTTTQVQYNSAGVLAGSAGLTWDGTTLATTGLNNIGTTVLGDAAGDTLTINGAAASTPNGLVFNTNQLVLKPAPFNQVAIGTTTVGSEMLTVGGAIRSTTGGYTFPDGTIQTTAAKAPTGTVFSGYYGNTPPPGYVMADGRTIGSPASNATNRNANDTQPLYLLLWNITTQTQCPVTTSTGAASTRGIDAISDWNANKRLALPDHSGAVAAGRDDLSGTNRNRLTPGMSGATTRATVGGLSTDTALIGGIGVTTSGNAATYLAGAISGTMTTDTPAQGGTTADGGTPGYAIQAHAHVIQSHGHPVAISGSLVSVGTINPGQYTASVTNVQTTIVVDVVIAL